jgi:NAD(P)-dependent dehydrogenase (short-subunit alcohol dehydrogenase family)
MEIKDKVALVTGGAARVGRIIGLTLAQKGAYVAFTYHSDTSPWQQMLADIESAGVQGLAIRMDVCQAEQVHAAVQAVVQRFGHIDILVNNASCWLSGPFLDITLAQWQEEMDTNLTGPFLCSQAAARTMIEQESGLIVNITDLSAYQTWRGSAHHAAAKTGLIALTRVMAAELAPYVRVNAIAPGTILLPPGATDKKRQWAEDNSLLKRIGTPEDVARTVVFLAESDFVTGSTYLVDGGRALV